MSNQPDVSDQLARVLNATPEESEVLVLEHVQKLKWQIADSQERYALRMKRLDEYIEYERRDAWHIFQVETEPLRRELDYAVKLLADREILKGPKPITVPSV
jgi:hypothetical protein